MLNTSFCCSSLTTHCVHVPLCSFHILMATDCHIPNSGRLLLVLFYSSLWFPFVCFKAGRRMPSIFMRFWYTSFHLLQYLLYQEIGGERMADQPDIASPAFQRRPQPLLSFFSFRFIPLSSTCLRWSHLNLSRHKLCVLTHFWKMSFFLVVWYIFMLTLVEPLVGSGPNHTLSRRRITFLRFTFPTNLMGV